MPSASFRTAYRTLRIRIWLLTCSQVFVQGLTPTFMTSLREIMDRYAPELFLRSSLLTAINPEPFVGSAMASQTKDGVFPRQAFKPVEVRRPGLLVFGSALTVSLAAHHVLQSIRGQQHDRAGPRDCRCARCRRDSRRSDSGCAVFCHAPRPSAYVIKAPSIPTIRLRTSPSRTWCVLATPRERLCLTSRSTKTWLVHKISPVATIRTLL